MQFRAIVKIDQPSFQIPLFERMLFVGSYFADNMGQRFAEDKFRVTINPRGAMYNLASILHTVERTDVNPNVAVFTPGTNHVYILKEAGEIVDNCQKCPQRSFYEAELNVEECMAYLSRAVECLMKRNDKVCVILTVSPIRYVKYGFHGNQLSKTTLLLTTRQLGERYPDVMTYFPAYETVSDESRNYRFYKEDMLHPSEQAVAYVWERFSDAFFSQGAKLFLTDWQPVKTAPAHRPFQPDGDAYQSFIRQTQKHIKELENKWGVNLMNQAQCAAFCPS